MYPFHNGPSNPPPMDVRQFGARGMQTTWMPMPMPSYVPPYPGQPHVNPNIQQQHGSLYPTFVNNNPSQYTAIYFLLIN